MNTKPGDFFLYYKAKTSAYPGESGAGVDWGSGATEPGWWEKLKGFFNSAEAPVPEPTAAPPPVNTGSLSQRLFRAPLAGPQMAPKPQAPGGLAGRVWSSTAPEAAEGGYEAASAMQQGLKPPGVLRSGLNAVKGGVGFLGKSLLTGATSTAANAVSRGAVKNITGSNEAVDEGPVGNFASHATQFVAPFLPPVAGAALSTVPAIGRVGGAVAGNLAGPSSGGMFSGAPTMAEFGPAAERHPQIKAEAQKPIEAKPTTQPELEALHKKDPFAVSFGPGWNDGKTEYRLNQPKPVK